MEKNAALLDIINTVLTNADRSVIDTLKPDTHLRNDLELDSLNLAELTVRVEERFGVDIFEDGMVNTIEEILLKLP